MRKITLIGACTDLGVHHKGTDLAPEVLLKHHKDYILIHKDKEYIKNTKKGDLRKNEKEINDFNRKLFSMVDTEIKKGNLPITVGGDHSISIASALASSNNKKIGIIWIDAHADFNTFETTTTGNIHGLPLATIVGYHNEDLRRFTQNTIDVKNAVIVGVRSIDELEFKNLELAGITYFTTEDIKEFGVHKTMTEAFKIALKDTDGVHISYDLDVIDPKIAPGVSIPEINGISEEEILEIVDEILKHKDRITSLDLVEFNPNYDVNEKTEKLANTILTSITTELEN